MDEEALESTYTVVDHFAQLGRVSWCEVGRMKFGLNLVCRHGDIERKCFKHVSISGSSPGTTPPQNPTSTQHCPFAAPIFSAHAAMLVVGGIELLERLRQGERFRWLVRPGRKLIVCWILDGLFYYCFFFFFNYWSLLLILCRWSLMWSKGNTRKCLAFLIIPSSSAFEYMYKRCHSSHFKLLTNYPNAL